MAGLVEVVVRRTKIGHLPRGFYYRAPVEPTSLGAAPGDVYVLALRYPGDTRVVLVQVGEWRRG